MPDRARGDLRVLPRRSLQLGSGLVLHLELFRASRVLRVGAFVALIDDHVLLVAQGRIDNRVRGRACQATSRVPCATRCSHLGSHCRTIARRHCQVAFVLLTVVLADRGAAGLASGGELVGCVLLDRGRLEEVRVLH